MSRCSDRFQTSRASPLQNVLSAPAIMAAVLSTVKSIPTEVIEGIKNAVNGKPSVPTPVSPKAPAAKAA